MPKENAFPLWEIGGRVKYEFPFTYVETSPEGKVLLQANYNSCLEIGELFFYCYHYNCQVKAVIESFKNMNREEWKRIEKMVAWDNMNRLTGGAS